MGKQKLYAYVDESGQDTEGRIFVVSIVVLDNERDTVRQRLEEIEHRTGKGAVKWHKSKHEFRRAYIEALAVLLELRHRAFVEVFYIRNSTLTSRHSRLQRRFSKTHGHPTRSQSLWTDSRSPGW